MLAHKMAKQGHGIPHHEAEHGASGVEVLDPVELKRAQ
jgi:hypothetical protein